jgi:hypothetical protein
VRTEWGRGYSAAAHGDDDFKLVAIDDPGVAMQAARHDLTVFFDGDALARQIQREHQLGDGKRCRKLPRLAVDAQGDHFVAPLKSSSIRGREFTSRV